jgi:hypothetical protein
MATAGAAIGLSNAVAETIAAAAAKRPIVADLPAAEEHAAAAKYAAVVGQSAAEQSVLAERGPAPDASQPRALPQRARATRQLPTPARRMQRLRVAAVVAEHAVAVAGHEQVAELAAGMTAAKTRSDLTAAEPGSDFNNRRRSLPAPPLCIGGTPRSLSAHTKRMGNEEHDLPDKSPAFRRGAAI